MKKSLLTAFIAIGIGIITSLQFVGADPIGVLFLKRVDTIADGTRINTGTSNTLLEFDIINGYETDAIIAGIDSGGFGSVVNMEEMTFSGSGFSFDNDITSLLIGAGETKRVKVDITLSASETIGDMQLLVDGMYLVSGSGVYLDSGSGLSMDDALEGSIFNVFPDKFGIKDATELLIPQTYTEDISLPIDFARGEYELSAQITLEPAIAIPGVTDGLRVVMPGGTIINNGGSSWAGQLEAPKVLGLPPVTNLPSGVTPQKRISVGVSGEALRFSSPVSISIPVSGTGIRKVYSSQNGVDWTYEIECTIADGICSFEVDHFTEFLVASVGNGDTIIGGVYGFQSSGGGQNTMRHGSYDPNRRDSQGVAGITPEMQAVVHERSTKSLRKYIPCEVDEENVLNNRFNNLRLLQGAPRVCKEDMGKYFDTPYRIGRR